MNTNLQRVNPSSSSPAVARPAARSQAQQSEDRLIGAIAANTDCLSAILDELRAIRLEESRSRIRLTICAIAAFPIAIGVLLGGLLLLLSLVAAASFS